MHDAEKCPTCGSLTPELCYGPPNCPDPWHRRTDDDELFQQIAERRNDAEFMERLHRSVAENQDILDRLADA